MEKDKINWKVLMPISDQSMANNTAVIFYFR